MPLSPIGQKIEAIVQSYHEKGAFDGVVLAAKGSAPLYRGAVGWANRQARIAHRLDAPFPLCSITKQFTALLAMQEVAAGRLKLDGTVADTLPDFRKATGARVTTRQLLMHTSGLPNTDDMPDFYTKADARLADPTYVVRTYLQGDLVAEPGATFHYNNADYLVLAAMLQQITGKTYPVLLRERILQPLGMTHSGLLTPGGKPTEIVGYDVAANGKDAKPDDAYRLPNYGAAGAMYSTVDDMLRWDRGLLTDRLLPRAFRDVMFTGDPKKGYVAFGSWVYAYLPFGGKTPTLIERQGGIGALKGQNLLAPEDDLQVVLLSNIDAADLAAYSGKGIACDILRVLYEK